MKSRIAFTFPAIALGLALGLAACAVEAGDDAAVSDEQSQLTAESASATTGNPSTQTEYTYLRCSLNGGLWLTRTSCQAACAGGTCRLVLICKNDQGQQIPCP